MSACIQKPLATDSRQVTGRELCTVWVEKCLVCCGVHSPPHWEGSFGINSPWSGGGLSSLGVGGIYKGGGGYVSFLQLLARLVLMFLFCGCP